MPTSSPAALTYAYARLHLYTLSFIAALGFYLLTNGVVHNLPYWLIGGASIALLTLSLMRRNPQSAIYTSFFLRTGVILGTGLSLASPLLTRILIGHESISTIVASQSIWAQLLLTLLAHQILAEESAIETASFLRRPIETRTLFQPQSLLAAVALGFFMTLCFYLILPSTGLGSSDPALVMISSALNGKTVIHLLIIFLFFLLMAVLFDSSYAYLQNRRIFRQVQQLVQAQYESASSPSTRQILAHVNQELAPQPEAMPTLTLMSQLIEAAQNPTTLQSAPPSPQDAMRLFLRRLIPLLPLLGFLGTVIGLASTMAQLPQGLATGGAHMADFTGALAGLAIKFETTLLGLLASLIATFLLNLLEKKEQEWAAQCAVLVGYLTKAPRPHHAEPL